MNFVVYRQTCNQKLRMYGSFCFLQKGIISNRLETGVTIVQAPNDTIYLSYNYNF